MRDYSKRFNMIRDIPYRIALSDDEENCSCVGKNRKLIELFEKDNIPVRWRICTFAWSDLGVPEKVLSLNTLDNPTHAYLEIAYNNDWTVVDATWDKGLSSVFPVNEWSDIPNMNIAVPEIEICSVERSADIMRLVDAGKIKTDFGELGGFYRELNKWLEEVRIS